MYWHMPEINRQRQHWKIVLFSHHIKPYKGIYTYKHTQSPLEAVYLLIRACALIRFTILKIPVFRHVFQPLF